MRVRVKYFGRFAVNIGKFSEEIEVPEGITVEKFIEILRSRYQSLENEEIEISIGGKYARKEEPIGNEVAIYPMISGDDSPGIIWHFVLRGEKKVSCGDDRLRKPLKISHL